MSYTCTPHHDLFYIKLILLQMMLFDESGWTNKKFKNGYRRRKHLKG